MRGWPTIGWLSVAVVASRLRRAGATLDLGSQATTTPSPQGLGQSSDARSESHQSGRLCAMRRMLGCHTQGLRLDLLHG